MSNTEFYWEVEAYIPDPVVTRIKTEPGTEVGIEVKTEPGTEVGIEVKTEPGTEVGTEAGTEVKTEPGTEVKTEPGTEVKAEPGTEVKTEPGTEVKTEIKTEVETGGPFGCKTCEKTFFEMENLIWHQSACELKSLFENRHQTPFACPICDAKFSKKGDRNRHFLRHKGERSFLCAICKNENDVKLNLRRYLLDPREEKIFTFQLTNNLLGRSQIKYLNKHLDDNTKGKPYAFYRPRKMPSVRQIRILHSLSIKPFKCEVCEKRYSEQSQLDEHLYAHSQGPFHVTYICDPCIDKALHEDSTTVNPYAFQLSHGRELLRRMKNDEKHEISASNVR